VKKELFMRSVRRNSRSLFRGEQSPRRSGKNFPRLEELETRTLLSAASTYMMTPAILSGSSSAVVLDPTFTPGVAPLTPTEMRSAYGVNLVQFSNGVGGFVRGDGTGQTIAIVDALNDPTIVADLATFDATFGLANPPSFTVLNQLGTTIPNQTGSPTAPRNSPHSSWSLEESLDVEWAHSIAPGANIVLFEANSASNNNLATAVRTAATAAPYLALGIPQASVISNSYGSSDRATDAAQDTSTYAPISNANQISLVFSSGDSGTIEYPSSSPYVLGVGGTEVSLKVGPFGTSWTSETTYNDQADVTSHGGTYGSSGGGVSTFESEPSYQLNYGITNTNSRREAPDVSMSGGLESGVYITDTYDVPGDSAIGIVFGTSLAAPMWGGLVAVTNQGRALAGESPIGNVQEAVYGVPATDFHDITTGTNGLTGANLHSAGPGYDEVTGIGSPIANRLIPDLVAYTGTGPVTFVHSSAAADTSDDSDDTFDYTITGQFGHENESLVAATQATTSTRVVAVESDLGSMSLAARNLSITPVTVTVPTSGQVERIDAGAQLTALPIPATSYVEGFHGSTDVLAGAPSDAAVPGDFGVPVDNSVMVASGKVFTPAASPAASVVQDQAVPTVLAPTVSVSDAVFSNSHALQALDTRIETPPAVLAGEETHTMDLAVLAGMALALGGSWSNVAQAEETRKYPALRR
jgi:subtilase family serine protease